MKKRIISIILLIVTVFSVIPASVGCAKKDDGKITVICTVFPIYDWVRNVVGESDTVEVKLLVSNGADLHSYQPTALYRCQAIFRLRNNAYRSYDL